MSNPYFHFKQFTIWHDRCAMKVNTDGVILGSWVPLEHPYSILDIGTGTGILALMLAQRCDEAYILAVEIEPEASMQAKENCLRSPWSHRVNVILEDFRKFRKTSLNKYDLIVSNPPYFMHSLGSPESKKHLARHNDTLNEVDLISGVKNLLQSRGNFAVILPYENKDLEAEALIQGLFLHRILFVRTKLDKPISRKILLYSDHRPADIIQETLTILNEKDGYSDAYKNLTREFYL